MNIYSFATILLAFLATVFNLQAQNECDHNSYISVLDSLTVQLLDSLSVERGIEKSIPSSFKEYLILIGYGDEIGCPNEQKVYNEILDEIFKILSVSKDPNVIGKILFLFKWIDGYVAETFIPILIDTMNEDSLFFVNQIEKIPANEISLRKRLLKMME